MFASINNADEHRPCLSISKREPYHPQIKHEIRPAVKIPICPTDE